MKDPGFAQWISWITGVLVAAMGFTAFAYSNFETKAEADRRETTVKERLDRISAKIGKMDDKLDELLQVVPRKR